MEVINHYNIRRVVDIYAAVQGRDLGAVAARSRALWMPTESPCRAAASSPSGASCKPCAPRTSGCWRTRLSIILVYLLIVVNFQSWLDPFIIITALPAALAGIVGLLLSRIQHSAFRLEGAIMCMGRRTANSILVVSLPKNCCWTRRSVRAAIEAGFTRFRPVLMTALAMIIA